MSDTTEERIQALLQNPLYYVFAGISFAIFTYAFLMSGRLVEDAGFFPATWKGTLGISAVAGPLFGLAMYGAIHRLKRKGTFGEHVKRQAARIDRGWLSLRHRYWLAAALAIVSLGVGVLLTYHAVADTAPPYVSAVAKGFYYSLLGSGFLVMGYGLYWMLTGKSDAKDIFEGVFFLRNRYVRGAAVMMGLLGGAALFYYDYAGASPFAAKVVAAEVTLLIAALLGFMIAAEVALRHLWQWRRKESQNSEAPHKA